ncbi:MAG: BatD family protein [Thermoguttaceae bacterium]|nr:BatD family protein [Thermoguttaceae bacterium]
MAKHSAMDKRYTKFSTTFPLRPAWAVILTVGAVIFTAAAAPAADSAAVMRLEASSSKVYEGSAFKLLVHLDNTDAETPPDMSYLESEFQVEYLGPSRRNATRITIINGRQVKDEDKGITFAYALTPKSSGKIEIASPEMTVGGQTLSAPSVLIEVIPPNGQDLVELQLSADTDSVYPLVPFEVTLTVLVRELPGKYALRDPIRLIAGEVSPPVLGISWADDSTLPDSLKPAEPWDEWITRYQDQRQGGFSINGIRAGGMFDLSWAFGGQTQNLAMFLPQPQRIERANPDGGTDRFWQYQFKRTFTAERTGPLSFDAVSLKGVLAKEGDDGKLAAEPIYALSQPLEITIRDVPEQGRPDNYVGAFGSFSLSASLTPQNAQVGEALTLSVTLQGTGSVLNVKAPDLEADPRIAERFRVYPPSEKFGDGQVQWTWSLRPTEPIDGEFPPIELSYFNVESEQFVPLASDPVPLKIEKAQAGTAARPARLPSAARLLQAEGGIFGNASAASGPLGRALPAERWWKALGLIWSIPLVVWGGVWLLRRRTESASVRLARRIADSRLPLAEGIDLFASSDRKNRAGGSRRIFEAFLLPVADRFPMAAGAVSAAEFLRLVETLRAGDPDGEGLYREVAAAVESLEQVQYGWLDAAKAVDWRDLHKRWSERLSRVKPRSLPKTDSKRNKAALLLLPALVGALMTGALSGCGGAGIDADFSAAEEQFRRAEALLGDDSGADNTAKDSAESNTEGSNTEDSNTEDSGAENAKNGTENSAENNSAEAEFLKAAALYEQMIDKYGENGAVLFNLGNAYLRASRSAEALAAWRRAEAYIPGDPYLKANIESVLPRLPSEKRPLFETLLPWQNHLSVAAKGYAALLFSAAAAVFIVILLIAGDRLGGASALRSALRRGAWVLLALTLIAGVSYLYDVDRFAPGTHGVAVVDTLPRKGASDRYDPLYRDRLPALSEMKIVDRQPGWLLAKFPDAQTGWLPADDVLVW